MSNNSVQSNHLPELIGEIYTALNVAETGGPAEVDTQPPVPAVSIKKSITPDYLICLEDGKKFKSLKRHLRTKFDMSPQDYRARWNLPSDYPMVAPNYAAARSELAKRMGLGNARKREAAAARKTAATPAASTKKRGGGRSTKAAAAQ